MTFEVHVSNALAAKVTERWGPERRSGRPSEWDFWSGPLTAALVAFRGFESLPPAAGPAVRTLQLVDPVFGALVFVGVLTGLSTVEIADVEDDPDYWRLLGDDPDD